jgi:hypothetical protein
MEMHQRSRRKNLRWYGHIQRREFVTKKGKEPDGILVGDGWSA